MMEITVVKVAHLPVLDSTVFEHVDKQNHLFNKFTLSDFWLN